MNAKKKTLWTLGIAISFLGLGLQNSAFAQGSQTRISSKRAQQVQAQPSAFSGSFEFAVGTDSNPDDDKDYSSGTFYKLAPTLNINKGGLFSGQISANMKDFNDQELSNEASAVNAAASVSLNAKLIGDTDSKTVVKVKHSDARTTGNDHMGKAVRYLESSITQSLSWDLGRLKLAAEGGAVNRDYSTDSSDGAEDIFNPRRIFKDRNKVYAGGKVGIVLSPNIEIAAKPKVSLEKYKDTPAFETDGTGTGKELGSPNRQYMRTELTAELGMKFAMVELTPSVISGLQNDRANGAEDYNYTGAGIQAAVLLHKPTNFKLTGGVTYETQKYDNWRSSLSEGDKRDESTTSASLGASVNIIKNISVALNYENTEEKSNLIDPTENYRQEIVTTGITMGF